MSGALNSLLEGVDYFDKKNEQITKLEIEQDAEVIYQALLTSLQSEFDIDEARAKELLALDNITYTHQLLQLTGQEKVQNPEAEGEQETDETGEETQSLPDQLEEETE